MRVAAERLALSGAELDALWLLASVELEPAIARAAHSLFSPGMHELNAQLFERFVDNAGDVLARLAQLELVEIAGERGTPLYRRSIRASDRVLDLVRGHLRLDRTLSGIAELVNGATCPEVDVPLELAHALAMHAPVLVLASGPLGSGRATLLVRACHRVGRDAMRIDARRLPADPAACERALRVLARECRLHAAWPLFRGLDSLGDRESVFERGLLAFAGPVLATSREPCAPAGGRTLVAVELGLPDEHARTELWRGALPGVDAAIIEHAAKRYRVGPGLIHSAAAAALARARRSSALTSESIQVAVRTQVEQRLAGLARRVESRQTWDDLVLPVEELDRLVELVARVQHRAHVLETWGFADKVGRGLGCSVLLSGPPGTGKTMIAGLLARELRLDLYQVDLSRIVSKYIGETEKQLSAVFDAAEAGHAVLLFDEADSLFAKRTQVKSSNDRYANLEVNYLLQRVEAFQGICVLTTNHETALDPAFQRRLTAHVRVPMPDREQRELLWKAMIPERAARTEELDLAGLAELAMSGGYIRNAVLRAAYLAAAEGSAITNAHLWRAARAEYEAMGKIVFQRAA